MGDGGADSPSVSSGTRFERIRVGGLRGGSELKSIGCVVAGRGGPPIGERGGGGMLPSCLPGDAVCARGGGGGGDGLGASPPA